MPKLGMQPLRQRQLIVATMGTLSRHGFARTTVARIARTAGMSDGIVHHYFGSKAELLAATMRALMVELRTEVVAGLTGVGEPRARLLALIDANLADTQFRPEVGAAWLAFWAEAPHDAGLGRLQRVYVARLRSCLRHELRRLLPPALVDDAVLRLAALIDGLYLRIAVGADRMTPCTARQVVRDQLTRELEVGR